MDPHSIDLYMLVDLFAASDPAAAVCQTPVGAYANCLAVSVLFARFLRERGVACALLHAQGATTTFPRAAGRWPHCDPAVFGHWVVRVGDITVDWTYRQFEPQAPWPRIVDTAQFADEWAQTEVWACERCNRLVDDERHRGLTAPGLDREHRETALRTGGHGPFSDPRHDRTAALRRLCAHGVDRPALTEHPAAQGDAPHLLAAGAPRTS